MSNRFTRGIVAVVAATAVVAMGAVYAVAGHDSGPPAGVTGCLNTAGGTLTKLAQGAAPRSGCGPNETVVHLGDVTAVTAGAGLDGGAAGGEAALGIADDYRLPGRCGDGEVAKWSASVALWKCAADSDSGGDIEGVDTPASGGLQGGAASGTPSLSIQPGYRLPQGCSVGQVAKAAGGGWGCAADADTTYGGDDFAVANQSCGSGQFATGVGSTGQLSCGTPAGTSVDVVQQRRFNAGAGPKLADTVGIFGEITRITLPAGRWVVTANVWIINNNSWAAQDNSRPVGCALYPDGATNRRAYAESHGRIDGFAGYLTPSLVYAFDVPSGGDIVLGCETRTPNNLIHANYWNIVATRATSITNQ